MIPGFFRHQLSRVINGKNRGNLFKYVLFNGNWKTSFLDQLIDVLSVSFSGLLLRLINQKLMVHVEVNVEYLF